MIVRDLLISTNALSRGTLTMSGGTLTVQSKLVVGLGSCATTGLVTMTGGQLFVTNAAHTAFIDVSSGTFTVNGGTLIADKLVVTNGCARFIHNGGVVSMTTTNLDPDLDADGDGLPNGWEQTYGLDPFNGTGDNGRAAIPTATALPICRSFTAGRIRPTPVHSPYSTTVGPIPPAGSGMSAAIGRRASRPRPTTWCISSTPVQNRDDRWDDLGQFPGSMTISNLTVAGVAGAVNTLQLTNAGTVTPLRISNALTLSTAGRCSSPTPRSGLTAPHPSGGPEAARSRSRRERRRSRRIWCWGRVPAPTGTLWVTGGSLSLSNLPSTISVGTSGDGLLIVSNGTLFTRGLFVGTNQFSRGTITSGRSSVIAWNVFIGLASNSTAAVWINGGEFVATNRVVMLGYLWQCPNDRVERRHASGARACSVAEPQFVRGHPIT